MTTGTVHTFDAHRGTGTVQTATGAVFPFSSRTSLAAGDAVSFSLVGGLAGVYALNVAPTAARHRAVRAAVRTFSFASPSVGTLALG